MAEPLIEMLPGPIDVQPVSFTNRFEVVTAAQALDDAELRRLLSRWASGLDPLPIRIGTGGLIGLTVDGHEDLDPLPIYVRVSLEYQLERARLTQEFAEI